MLLAGDVGGTKTNLALFENDYIPINLTTFPSKNYIDLESLIKEYLSQTKDVVIERAVFAIAGPVHGGICKATNLPWLVESDRLARALSVEKVLLLNDLEASGYALEILDPKDLVLIYEGKKQPGNKVIVSPGTGLGEAGLYWDGRRYHPFAGEGGHCEFGPRDKVQIQLAEYLIHKFGHPSYERLLSGPGLYTIYQFYKDVLHREEEEWLQKELIGKDPAKVITRNALEQKSRLCIDTLKLFVAILGSEAGNCALKFLALGGVYLGGGIPPKILNSLREANFHDAFVDKGRFRSLLEEVPIWVILDDKASLKGAARFCYH